MRMRRITLPSVDCPALFYFPTLSHQRHDIGHKMWVSILSTTVFSETFLIVRRTEWDITKDVHWSSCKAAVSLVRFQWHLIFSTDLEKHSNTKFHENPSSGGRVIPCWPTDKRMARQDEASLRCAFRNLANGPGKQIGAENIQNWEGGNKRWLEKICIVESFMICTAQQMLLGCSNQGGWKGCGTCVTRDRREMRTLFWCGRVKKWWAPLGIPRSTWEDNMEMDLKGVGRRDAWLQASAAVQMRSEPFWDLTQRILEIIYRPFGTTYRSHLQGSSTTSSLKMESTAVPKRRYIISNIRCVRSPERADLGWKEAEWVFSWPIRIFIRALLHAVGFICRT
jgi:hypothetical protein